MMKSSQKHIFCLCMLLISFSIIEAGPMKERRQSEMAMLLAGGLLATLLRGGAGSNILNLGHGLGHNLGSVLGGHSGSSPMKGFGLGSILGGHRQSNSMAGLGHNSLPGLNHGMGHPMGGMPHPYAGMGYNTLMGGHGTHMPFPGMGYGGLGKNMPFSGMGHGGHVQNMPFAGMNPGALGNIHPFAGLPHNNPYGSLQMPHPLLHAHNLPVFMHGHGLPISHSANLGHGFKGTHGLKNDRHQNNYQQSNVFKDEEFHKLFQSLERQDLESYADIQDAKMDDSTAPVRSEEEV